MNIKKALEEGILKKEFKDLEKSKKSLETCEVKLKDAEILFNLNQYESCVIFSYTSMFHAGRALLFKEGYREKGHIGLIIFLEEIYSDKIGKRLIHGLDRLRKERHDVLYSLEKEEFGEKDARHALNIAKEFIKKVEGLI